MKQLDDIATLLNAMRDRGAEMKAFEGLLAEANAALADIVSLMEKNAKREAKETTAPAVDSAALASALSGALATLTFPAPVVNVTVPEGKTPAAAEDKWKSLKVSIQRDQYGGGPMQSFTITRA